MVVIHWVVDFKFIAHFLKLMNHGVGQHRELLVGRGRDRERIAQWTATASGCCILGRQGDGPYITHVTCGRIMDLGIKDVNNMGAAMAPAAYDTLAALFRET